MYYDEATPNAKVLLDVLTQIKADVDASKVVESLEIITEPNKTVYAVGELFEKDGIEILVTFADGSTDIIISGFSYTPGNPLRATHTEVIFKYGGKTVAQAIEVK